MMIETQITVVRLRKKRRIRYGLKIRNFFEISRNAIMTQIWIALITMLVLAYMKFLANIGQSISQVQRLLPINLFKR